MMTSHPSRVVHPFFNASNRQKTPDATPPNLSSQPATTKDPIYSQHVGSSHTQNTPIEEMLSSSAPKASSKTRSSPRRPPTNHYDGTTDDLEVDPNKRASKRRKTNSPQPANDTEHAFRDPIVPDAKTANLISTEDTQQPTSDRTALQQGSKTLKLNGRGGFGSPQKSAAPSTPKKKRGRPRKSDESQADKRSLIAVISYAQLEELKRREIAAHIDDILEGVVRPQPLPAPPAPSKIKAVNASKAAHPFFTSKKESKENKDHVASDSAAKTDASIKSPIKSFTTPRKFVSNAASKVPLRPQFSSLADRLGGRKPDVADAPWTCKDVIVANRTPALSDLQHEREMQNSFRHRHKKQKSHELDYTTSLRLSSPSKARLGAAPSPRNPTKSISTGPSLTNAIQQSLSTPLSTHEAITKLLSSLPSQTSSYDEAAPQTQLWIQRYAPQRASEVLPGGKEVTVLRSWLASLTLHAVQKRLNADTINVDRVKRSRTDASTSRKGRKRRPSTYDDLDDFIVEGDEDETEMHELSDCEDTHAESSHHTGQRSLVRRNCYSATLQDKTNAVLLSGPHGCGKTAAALAVAKELHFEVFEINSSSRRNKQDVFDRVGDLTRNHQVRQATVNETSTRLDDGESPSATASSEHDKLTSFFQTGSSKSRPNQTKASKGVDLASKLDSSAAKPATQQRQALILIEEADVLFHDDKQFWEAVLELAIKSRRPIILTCTDETEIPIHALSLHAILRLRPAPLALAADYMLLVAALEGHVLERQEIEHLYQSCHNDLRAAISELNFWCQMAVGDAKGGFDWLPKRWPKGIDCDAAGRRLRTLSNGTYHSRLGGLISVPKARNSTVEDFHAKFADLGRECGLNPADVMSHQVVESIHHMSQSMASGLHSLHHCSTMYDRLSDLASYSASNSAACPESDVLDLTQPDMSAKELQDYPTLHLLRQADVWSDPSNLASNIDFSTCLIATSVLNDVQGSPTKRSKRALKFIRQDLTSVTSRDNGFQSIKSPDMFDVLEPLAYDSEDVSVVEQSTTSVLAEEVSPYVRMIASFDLDTERCMNELAGPRDKKRLRMTRVARSALEGSSRASKRRELWWPKQLGLDLAAVVQTGGKDWPKMEGVDTASSTTDEHMTYDD